MFQQIKIGKLLLLILTVLAVGYSKTKKRKILGGMPASEGQFPYMASIRMEGWGHACGGAIISSYWILTAGHCFLKGIDIRYYIVIGTLKASDPGEEYEVSKIITGETSNIEKSDVALVKIKDPIVFSENVQAIPLGTEPVKGNVDAVLTGWGSSGKNLFTEHLQYIRLKTMDLENCKSDLNPKMKNHFRVYDFNTCTVGSVNKGACNMDSGGPLVSGGKIIGVVSWGIVPCGLGWPDVFSSVAFYNSWIIKTVQEN